MFLGDYSYHSIVLTETAGEAHVIVVELIQFFTVLTCSVGVLLLSRSAGALAAGQVSGICFVTFLCHLCLGLCP